MCGQRGCPARAPSHDSSSALIQGWPRTYKVDPCCKPAAAIVGERVCPGSPAGKRATFSIWWSRVHMLHTISTRRAPARSRDNYHWRFIRHVKCHCNERSFDVDKKSDCTACTTRRKVPVVCPCGQRLSVVSGGYFANGDCAVAHVEEQPSPAYSRAWDSAQGDSSCL